MDAEDLVMVDRLVSDLQLYRRAHLPDRCYACGSADFNYAGFKCECGVDVYSCADSMAFVLERNADNADVLALQSIEPSRNNMVRTGNTGI